MHVSNSADVLSKKMYTPYFVEGNLTLKSSSAVHTNRDLSLLNNVEGEMRKGESNFLVVIYLDFCAQVLSQKP